MKLAGKTMTTAVGVLCAGLTLTACGSSTQTTGSGDGSPAASSPTASASDSSPSASNRPTPSSSSTPSSGSAGSSKPSSPSGSSGSGSSGGSGGSSGASGGTSGTSGGSGGSSGTSGGSGSSLRKCDVNDVRARIVTGNPGAGQRYAAIVLTNSGSTPCTVYGYGGMQLENSAGKVPTNLERTAPSPKTVTLIPNGSASSLVHWTVIPSGSESSTGACEPTATTALVTPPDETHTLKVAWNLGPVCGKGTIQQDPYVPGTGG